LKTLINIMKKYSTEVDIETWAGNL
jgi:hypothetical protein